MPAFPLLNELNALQSDLNDGNLAEYTDLRLAEKQWYKLGRLCSSWGARFYTVLQFDAIRNCHSVSVKQHFSTM